jgi:hypothetical protein
MSEEQIKQDCYFYTDQNLDVSEQTIKTMCVECYKNSDVACWFWEGSRLGYGPFNFICDTCGHTIHKKKDDK